MFTLQLLHLADGEAGLLASGETEAAENGTAANLAALVDAFDDDYANTLILAGGDNFIPGPFLSAGTDPSLNALLGTAAFGRADIAIHNAIGVQASTIGNHEFDLGSAAFAASFTPAGTPGTATYWEGALFPYLSSNLIFTGDTALNPRFTQTVGVGGLEEASTLNGRIAPSTVVTINGEKIGLVGATTQILERISSPSGTEVLGFPLAGQPGDNQEVDDMVLLASQLQPVIDDLRSQGVNKIILQAHLQSIANEQLLATLLEGVDIILAAGSNTRLGDSDDEAVAFPGHTADFANTYPIVTAGADGKPTLIVNTDNEYTYLGRLVVEFDANGEIILSSLDESINGAYASSDENVTEAWGGDYDAAFAAGTKGGEVLTITEAVQAVISAQDGNVYGFTDVYLEGERVFVRSQQTNLGDLSAESQVAAAQAADGGEYVVALKNGGGIRAQIGSISQAGADKLPPAANPEAGKPEGGVSELDVKNSLRFDNKLMLVDVSSADLLAILEFGVAAGANQGRFPQIAGVRFSFDPAAPVNARVKNVALIDENDNFVKSVVENGMVVADAPSVITLVTLSFLAGGGDGYPINTLGENFRYLLNDGTVSAPLPAPPTTTTIAPANALGEQQALADYLGDNHATPETAYDREDGAQFIDGRIQNLAFRGDNVQGGFNLNLGVADEVFEGGDLADAVGGARGNDELFGQKGADTLYGGEGEDSLRGGAGDDVLQGDAGGDALRGRDGADRFVFKAVTDSHMEGPLDRVIRFQEGVDKLDFRGFDADSGVVGVQAFAFIGYDGFSGVAGELRTVTLGANKIRVEADVDGDGFADFGAVLTGAANVTVADFLLV